MNETDLIEELSRQTGVPEPSVRAVFDAIRDLARDGRLSEEVLHVPGAGAEPGVTEADALIASARNHPLGLDFLKGGFLGSVAAVFGANAFTVEEAREQLNHEPVEAAGEVKI